jgi:hypothetical protein
MNFHAILISPSSIVVLQSRVISFCVTFIGNCGAEPFYVLLNLTNLLKSNFMPPAALRLGTPLPIIKAPCDDSGGFGASGWLETLDNELG